MANTGQKLETRGVIIALLSLVLMNMGCEDKIDSPAVDPSEGKMVEVSLNIGFTDKEDGYALGTKSGTSTDKGAFSCELQPMVITKGSASVKPDKLYNLEIQQYDQTGKRVGGMSSAKTQDIGSTINVSLEPTNDNAGCQLVIVAWGDNTTTTRLGTSNTLKDVQKLFIDASDINSIPTDNMNKMPYVLHLKHVKVEDGSIKSIDGHDVRLLLKRLATRLTINWDYKVTDYTLNQIILQSIPLNYNVVAAPDENETYPSLLDQYTSIQLSKDEIENSGNTYSCWIPANVRGFNTASNSPLYRIKANAPTGSAYASFIAKNNSSGSKEKLNYRVYLGGKDYSDFNLYGNTDYSYTVTFKHEGIPTNDYRVTYINPISASENNENFVNTANCFMVTPGGAFCFNPYKYYIDGKVIENDLLQGWCKDSKIQSVRVFWQTLEDGDLGDPILGTVNSSDDHTNIVDIKDGNIFNAARIYCRVAPNTKGGNGLIAAYTSPDGSGKPVWSWHIWVTTYRPDNTGNTTVLDPDKRKLKFTRGSGSDQLPMMDRNLGAMAGYVDAAPTDALDRAKSNGFHYQWGRKDPFPSSYTNDNSITTVDPPANNDKPVPGILNLYKADGLTCIPLTTEEAPTDNFKTAYNFPLTIFALSMRWLSPVPTDFNLVWLNKSVHDPCPQGWKVPTSAQYKRLVSQIANGSSIKKDGGALLRYDTSDNDKYTYIRFTGYWYTATHFSGIGEYTLLWCGDDISKGSGYDSGAGGFYFRVDNKSSTSIITTGHQCAALSLRCIQERDWSVR